MWVYRGNSLRARLQLARPLGYWVDYWLFLHTEETQPVWASRPLGLRAMAEFALSRPNKKDRVFREQIADEVVAASRLYPFVALPKPPDQTPLNAGAWDKAWLHWLAAVQSLFSKDELSAHLARALAASLSASDLERASFLTRRLAAELADQEWSDRVLYATVRKRFCDESPFKGTNFNESRFADELSSVLQSAVLKDYVVSIPVTPAHCSAVIAKQFAKKVEDGSLELERTDDGRYVAKQVTVRVRAAHAGEATATALNVARRLIEDLRLKHYVLTRLSGVAQVTQVEPAFQFVMNLPGPFWYGGRGVRRDIPHLPHDFDGLATRLPLEQRSKWLAARSQLSQALGVWPEDPHAAASHVWQALEAFSSGMESGWRSVGSLVPTYLHAAVREMGEHLARGVTNQQLQLREIGEPCDWWVFNARRASLDEWLKAVMSESSSSWYGRRCTPAQPDLLFSPKVGLLHVIWRRLHDERNVTWLDRRAIADVKLLYGLRNAQVHRGERLLTPRMAAYLARTGIEVLLTVMNEDASRLREDSAHETKNPIQPAAG